MESAKFQITGAMEEAAKRYRQGLFDLMHPVDAVRSAVLETWRVLRPESMPRGCDERRFVAALLRGARHIAHNTPFYAAVEDEPRERVMSLSECRAEVCP